MRNLGYILLIVGFIATNWKIMHARDIKYTVVSEELRRMPQQESYSREDVRKSLDSAVTDSWLSMSPWSFFPSWAMLAGGVLLGISCRQKRRSDHAV
jgi:hypothetical protein